MSLFASWILFPAVLALLALGCGVGLEATTRVRLPGPLLAPAGLAVMIVVAGFTTLSPATASLTIPIVVGLAAAGLARGIARAWTGRIFLPLFAAGAVFFAYAAPVVMSGQATFAGYIKLDDTATFLALTDRVMNHGHSLAGLAPSSYEATLAVNLAHGYPVGSLLPFGVGRALVGIDGAWVYQPYLAFLASMLALVLYELARRVVRSARLSAVAAIVAAQPALLYGFALWGGIKELAAAPMIALAATLAPTSAGEFFRPRRLLPAAVAAAAVVGVLSIGGAVWLLLPAGLVLIIATRGRTAAITAAAFAGAVLLLSLPTLIDAGSFLSPATEAAVRSSNVLGNLAHPLDKLQIFGVWPTGDFRFDPSDRPATWILIGTVAAAGLAGVGFALRARVWSLVVYVGTATVGCALVGALASPWVVAKAYTIASPACVLAAVVGCAGLVTRKRATEGILGLALVSGGVLWSNVLAYHDVNLAPRRQLLELERIGERFAGDGPALMTEYQPYGVRHFLRALDPEGASELRRRQIPLRSGKVLGKGAFAELADFDQSAIRVYRLLVLRRSPLSSRPPSRYQLVWRGHFYDVWQTAGARNLVGNAPRCGAVRTLAGSRPGNARPLVIGLGRVDHPSTWPIAPGGQLLYPSGSGVVRARMSVSRTARYSIWIGGSFRDQLSMLIDGKAINAQTHQLNNSAQYTSLGSATLETGVHQIELRYSSNIFAPGSGGSEYGLGPLILSLDRSPC